ncbi:hypothetical protein Hanom_Chr02g00132741 [Helianthus anomalus]
MVVRMMKWMPWLTFWCCNRFRGVWAGCFHSWEVALEVFDVSPELTFWCLFFYFLFWLING